LSATLERLTLREWTPAARDASGDARRPNGNRRFAQVGDAVVQVLREAGTDMRFIDVHRKVERLLDESVSRSTVKNYLAGGCRRKRPLFERVSHGRYRLL
jgi:hypothetical protein